MQKFFNLAFVPLLISLSSFNLDSCSSKSKSAIEFTGEAEHLTPQTIEGDIDGSNFNFNNNKKNRYFTIPRDSWCHGIFSNDTNPWTYNKIAKVYVSDDTIWDKVASAYNFNRSTDTNEISEIMSTTYIHEVLLKFQFNAKKSKDSCYLIDIDCVQLRNKN